VADFAAVIPEVSGEAYFTGTSSFFVDQGDPLGDGFIFR
jgi:proline racemase